MKSILSSSAYTGLKPEAHDTVLVALEIRLFIFLREFCLQPLQRGADGAQGAYRTRQPAGSTKYSLTRFTGLCPQFRDRQEASRSRSIASSSERKGAKRKIERVSPHYFAFSCLFPARMFPRRLLAQITPRTLRRVPLGRCQVYPSLESLPIVRSVHSAPVRAAALQSTTTASRTRSLERPEVAPINGESYTVGPTTAPLENRTLGDFFDETVKLYPTSPALISRHEAPDTHSLAYRGGDLVNEECLRWNYVEFQENVDALARGLLKMGLKSQSLYAFYVSTELTVCQQREIVSEHFWATDRESNCCS